MSVKTLYYREYQVLTSNIINKNLEINYFFINFFLIFNNNENNL